MDLTTTDQAQSFKSFWERREGTAGMVVVALLGVAGLFAAKALLPTIIAVLTMGTVALGQLWMMTILGGSLALLLWVLFATNLPKLVGYWFKAMVKRATGVFVAVYPIEIMQEFIAKLRGKKEVFAERKREIAGQKKTIDESLKANEREQKERLSELDYAKKNNDDMSASLASRKFGRLVETREKFLEPSKVTLDQLYGRLGRIEKVIDFKIEDMSDEIKEMKLRHSISSSVKGAINAARAILSGNDPDQELYDMATEYVVEDHRATMGMVDDLMLSTEDILSGVDLKNGIWEEKALQALANMERGEQLLLSKTPKAGSIHVPAQLQPVSITPLPSSNTGSKYFNE